MTTTLKEFVTKYQVTANVVRILKRPDRQPTPWDKGAKHYFVELVAVSSLTDNPELRQIWAGYYSQGSACAAPPTAEDVLDSLRLDIAGDESFAEWCANLGYDTDSRKALALFESCMSARNQIFRNLDEISTSAFTDLENCEGL